MLQDILYIPKDYGMAWHGIEYIQFYYVVEEKITKLIEQGNLDLDRDMTE